MTLKNEFESLTQLKSKNSYLTWFEFKTKNFILGIKLNNITLGNKSHICIET
jgi:hypothetical protein